VTTGGSEGKLILEGAQVGDLLVRVDAGDWNDLANGPYTLPAVTDGKGHSVQVIVNDSPGSYGDNHGALSVQIVRTKA
jgi:hypothetical protein